MTRLPSKVQTGACSSSRTRSLKCVPLALSSSSWPVRNESGLVRVAVGMAYLGAVLKLNQSNTRADGMGTLRSCVIRLDFLLTTGDTGDHRGIGISITSLTGCSFLE